MNQYAELHCHSSFSLLDGASNPEELVAAAKVLGLRALAITDHNDLGGIVRFAEAGKELNFPVIIGAEITLDDDSHLILLVEENTGYKNLCHLINEGRFKCNRGVPKISYETLSNYTCGLIALSGCPHGAIPSHIAAGNIQEAQRLVESYKDIFADRFYIELWDHGLAQEAVLGKQLYELANRYAIPCVVTNNVHYASRNKRIIHDALTCLKYNVTLETAGRRLRPNDNWCLRSPQEMQALWRNYPQFLQNTIDIADRCQFQLTALKPALPHFPTPNNLSHDQYLEQLVWEGAKKLYGSRAGMNPRPYEFDGQRHFEWADKSRPYEMLTPRHIKQIEHELGVIGRMQFAPYFLIMWDIVMFARSQGILVQGRGSAANSVICYCLFITAVDPVAMDLLFERFICEGKDDPPDIDLDIAHQHREIVLQYVYNKYGREHAGMVCEAITYRGRSAIKDAARVLGVTPLQKNTQLLVEIASGLEDLPRHRSIHVGGFVLCGEPLGQFVPIEPASMPGRTIIQWDKDDLVPMGMFKLDLLGLGMLSMIQEAMRLIKLHRNIDFDLSKLDMHDAEVFEMLQQADTIGIFQIESRAQMSILPKLKPICFYDLVVSIALIRPGPIQGNIVHPYLRRRRGLESITYPHPDLKPVLERTLGVPLFQEQGMRVATIAGGFTAVEADQLRRVMSFKRGKEKMSQICVKLSAGMRKNGYSEETITSLIKQLEGFANYGFPESHSASFALLAYASAYLKKHFAPEFYCATLNAQPLGFYNPNTIIQDALRHNVKILPLDLASSNWDCTLEAGSGLVGARFTEPVRSDVIRWNRRGRLHRPAGGCNPPLQEIEMHPSEPFAVRLGLRYMQGLGSKAKKLLEQAWEKDGAFTSAEDVCRRSQLGEEMTQSLAKAGAFETFIPDRRQALWQVLSINKREDKPLTKKQKNKTAPILPMTALEKTIADYQTQQLSVHAHMMQFYRPWAKSLGMRACADLKHGQNGEYITVAACVICRQRPGTAKGFMFFTLEDETGLANIIIKPDFLKRYKKVLLEENFLAISGKLQIDEGVINIIATDAKSLPPLPGAPSLASRDFH